MKISREVKTAILVILGIILLVFLINYLKGINLFDSTNKYHTEFEYNSLSMASPVTIKGNSVGKIDAITYDYKTGKTKVTIAVDEALKFSKNSKIRMYETGLMGGNGLAIVPAEGGEIAKDGDTLESEVEFGLVTSLSKNFSGLSDNLDVTLKSADTLLTNLNKLVVDDSENGMKRTIAELNSTIVSFKTLSNSFNTLLAKNDAELTSAIKNFNTISANMAIVSEDLKTVEISKSVAELDQTLANINSLMADIKSGNGSIGKLLKDEALYDNLEGASKQLEELLQDMKLNPKRYVRFSLFGKKPKQYDAEGNEIKDKN
ncbi:MAG: MCE family protein, partial [Gelidibacter sp.]|nr:MCE family protein [Gelidibacter sp.]